MLLVVKDENEILLLTEKLNNCKLYNRFINIHMCLNGVVIRNSIIPKEIDVEENCITISSDSFYIDIDIDKLNYIEYEEGDNSFNICLKKGDIYIDFMDEF